MGSTNAIIKYGIRLQSTTNAGLLKAVLMKNSKKILSITLRRSITIVFKCHSGSQ